MAVHPTLRASCLLWVLPVAGSLTFSSAALGREGSSEAFGAAPAAEPVESPPPPHASESLRRDTASGASNKGSPLAPWLLSVEAVTHAPVDVGFQVGGETPFGLHVYAGLGWIPSSYAGLLRGIAASATSDPEAHALLEQADYTGNTWRIQLGIRPFKRVGLYLDAGYSHVSFSGSANLSESGDPMLVAIGGNYLSSTALDMWLVELGYLGEIENRLVLGAALGLMHTMDSSTTLTRTDGASSPIFGALASRADTAFESYGTVPTLTLRVGFDIL